jgi:hypothetical protein
LWMPHSISRFDGRLTALDSMRGTIVSLNWRSLAGYTSFARGLDFDGRYHFIGLSQHRHPDMLRGQRNLISIDSGVAVFDAETCMSKFISFPNAESIHSLICRDSVCANESVTKS